MAAAVGGHTRKALILGGAGQLGRKVVSRFGIAGWSTTSVDLVHNVDAGKSIIFGGSGEKDEAYPIDNDPCDDWVERALRLTKKLREDESGFQSVVVTAGGWAGGHIGDAEGLRSVDVMWQRCIQSAAVGGHLASNVSVCCVNVDAVNSFSARLLSNTYHVSVRLIPKTMQSSPSTAAPCPGRTLSVDGRVCRPSRHELHGWIRNGKSCDSSLDKQRRAR